MSDVSYVLIPMSMSMSEIASSCHVSMFDVAYVVITMSMYMSVIVILLYFYAYRLCTYVPHKINNTFFSMSDIALLHESNITFCRKGIHAVDWEKKNFFSNIPLI